jgi:hypothetical protein
MGGVFCEDCQIAEKVAEDSNAPFGVRPWAFNAEFAKRLWDVSEELTEVAFEM